MQKCELSRFLLLQCWLSHCTTTHLVGVPTPRNKQTSCSRSMVYTVLSHVPFGPSSIQSTHCIGEGPESRPFSLVIQSWGFFHFLEIVTGWLVPSAGQRRILVQPGWYLPPQKIPLAENKFLQAGKGAENTKEKSRQCFTGRTRLICLLALWYTKPFCQLGLCVVVHYQWWWTDQLRKKWKKYVYTKFSEK